MSSKQNQPPTLFLTCEHAGNRIPARYQKLFVKNQGVLLTHRGSDPGAFALAKEIARLTKTKLHAQMISRLVIDMNRSLDSETLLSRWTNSLPPYEQHRIIETIYWPYRNEIYSQLAQQLSRHRQIVHVGMHSFSPHLDPARRSCHIGILFDPKSRFEKAVAGRMRVEFKRKFPKLGTRMNYPYRGDGDGMTTDLRNIHPQSRYAGIELELNQAFLKKLFAREQLKLFARELAAALQASLDTLP